MKLLFVEPDVLLARNYQEYLQATDHDVRTVRTAQAAVHAVDDELPDAIILEIQLVSHSGVEFLYELRSYDEWQHIPVLVLSLVPPGEFKASWQQLHDELGVQAYLYKPHTSLAKLGQAIADLSVAVA